MKEQILGLLRLGWSYSRIVAELGCSQATISYHANRHGLASNRNQAIYNWREVQKYYDEGNDFKACVERFGFSGGAWHRAIREGHLIASRKRLAPLSEVLVLGRKNYGSSLKKRLLRAGVLRNECYECGLTGQWRGKPIVLQIDHVSGVKNDWRPENLRMLCPNCHSQTDTFAGKNIGRATK